jgi:hypothetical protein
MESKVANRQGFVGHFISNIKDKSIIDQKSIDFLLNLESKFNRELEVILQERIVEEYMLKLFYEKGINYLKFVLTVLNIVPRKHIKTSLNSLNDKFKVKELLTFVSRPLLLLLSMLCLSEGGISLRDLRTIKEQICKR